MESPPSARRAWTSFIVCLLLGAAMAAIAVLVLSLTGGDLSAQFESDQARSLLRNRTAWVPFTFAVVFAILAWVFGAFSLRDALRVRAERMRG